MTGLLVGGTSGYKFVSRWLLIPFNFFLEKHYLFACINFSFMFLDKLSLLVNGLLLLQLGIQINRYVVVFSLYNIRFLHHELRFLNWFWPHFFQTAKEVRLTDFYSKFVGVIDPVCRYVIRTRTSISPFFFHFPNQFSLNSSSNSTPKM